MKTLASRLTLLILIFLGFGSYAQDGVSIGRSAPDESAVLHITSPSNNKGVLFPSMPPSSIRNVTSPSNGLFIYDNIFSRYTYFKNGTWMYLNPWDTEEVNPDNTGATDEDITYISTPYEVHVNNDVSADHFDGFGVVPIGGIIMWSGPVGNIPPNFEICDGGSRNGVTIPNLTGRFIRAAATPGGTGGVDANSTTRLSYVETPRFRIGGSDCQTFQFIYESVVTVRCEFPEGIVDEMFSLRKPAASCEDVFFELVESLPGQCGLPPATDIEGTCTRFSNPNYYMTNPACRNDGVREVDAVTGTENRPLYYDLAYIIRVE